LLALFALAACGDDVNDDGGDNGDTPTEAGDGNGEESARIDACALITQDEADAVLGAPTGEPVRGDTPPVNSCAYQTEDFDGVSVTVVTHEDKAEAERAYLTAIDINDYPEIGSLGDRAYNAQPIGDVTVLVGRYELSVDVSGPENDLEAAQDLAETAIGRMP
ncbi:MAG: DUF3558 family protein, partial [Woeseiaceae bacterium]